MADPKVEEVKKKVEEMIKSGKKAGYTEAAANLEHYMTGGGKKRTMPAAAFQSEDFLLKHLKSKHLDMFLKGAEKRLKAGKLKGGKSVDMTWEDSVYSDSNSKLFYALGGFTVFSEVSVEGEAIPGDDSGTIVRFTSWKVTCSDRYDWDKGKSTYVPGFGDVDDEDLALLSKAGAKPFDIVSDKMDMLKTLSKSKPFIGGRPEVFIKN
jgi:hypothetical protein